MDKIYKQEDPSWSYHYLWFFCPGCETNHRVRVGAPDSPNWSFNGNYEAPTLRPSVMVQYGNGKVCHSFITDGRIQFLVDSYHKFAGHTVDIPESDITGAIQ